MIKEEDISIVIQGPILYKSKFNTSQEITKLVCKRARYLFPHSEIILSTWENENTTNLIFDKLVLNKDPGATWFNYENYDLLNNCNRLIVSTKAGIAAASGKYVLKIRSDLFIISKKFLQYFYKFPYFDKQYQFVKNRILAFSIYSIKGHKTCLFTMQRPFHISDWAYFGYQEDLYDLYDIPLTQEPEFSQWFLTRCKPFFDIEPARLWKMPPEQYVTSTFLKKYISIDFQHTADISNNNLNLSEKLLANNFLILDQTQFMLISLKYMNLQILFNSLLSRTAIFHSSWLNDYYKYCCRCNLFKKFTNFSYIISRKIIYHLLNFILRPFEKLIIPLIGYFINKTTKNHS